MLWHSILNTNCTRQNMHAIVLGRCTHASFKVGDIIIRPYTTSHFFVSWRTETVRKLVQVSVFVKYCLIESLMVLPMFSVQFSECTLYIYTYIHTYIVTNLSDSTDSILITRSSLEPKDIEPASQHGTTTHLCS